MISSGSAVCTVIISVAFSASNNIVVAIGSMEGIALVRGQMSYVL